MSTNSLDETELKNLVDTIREMNAAIEDYKGTLEELRSDYGRRGFSDEKRMNIAKLKVRYGQDLRRTIRVRDAKMAQYAKLLKKLNNCDLKQETVNPNEQGQVPEQQ